MADNEPQPVSLSVGDVLSLREAARVAGAAETTVARWAARHGIGRQMAPNAPWRISGPALRMFIAYDTEALEAFRMRDFDSELVRPYIEGRAAA